LSSAVCPWCGHDDDYGWADGMTPVRGWWSDGSFTARCASCGKMFKASAPLEVYFHSFWVDEEDFDESKVNHLYDGLLEDEWDQIIYIGEYNLRQALAKRKELERIMERRLRGSGFDASLLGSGERIVIGAPVKSIAVADTFDAESLFDMPEPKKEFDISALTAEAPARKNTFDVSSLLAPVKTKAFDASALFNFSKRKRTKGAR